MPKHSWTRLAKPINTHRVQKKHATLIQQAIVDYVVLVVYVVYVCDLYTLLFSGG
jgi:hypothetical protein